jgi:hypothetical protein
VFRLFRRDHDSSDTRGRRNTVGWANYRKTASLGIQGVPQLLKEKPMSCYRHPEREATLFCQKDLNYMCRECACCHSPRVYCQYRSACVINSLTKEGLLSPCEEPPRKQIEAE